MKSPHLAFATAAGLVLQQGMVLIGHLVPAVRDPGYAIGGMGFSLIAGALYALRAQSGWRDVLLGGAVCGAACAAPAIAFSTALGETPVSLLSMGTVASTVTGLIGGVAVKAFVPAMAPAVEDDDLDLA